MTVLLQAKSAGYLAAELCTEQGVTLSVHSVFRHAVNLADREGEICLMLLSGSSAQNYPDAVCLSASLNYLNWLKITALGDKVQTSGSPYLNLNGYRISWEHAYIWPKPDLSFKKELKSADYLCFLEKTLSVFTQEAESYCLKQQAEGKKTTFLPQRKNSRLPEIPLSLQSSEAEIQATIRQYIGFGQGLTPESDDYWLGYLALLRSRQSNVCIKAHYLRVQNAISLNLSRTTDISRHYLKRALQGDFSEAVSQALIFLNTPGSKTSPAVIAKQILNFGSSSGLHCLAGMLHGMRTLSDTLLLSA